MIVDTTFQPGINHFLWIEAISETAAGCSYQNWLVISAAVIVQFSIWDGSLTLHGAGAMDGKVPGGWDFGLGFQGSN